MLVTEDVLLKETTEKDRAAVLHVHLKHEKKTRKQEDELEEVKNLVESLDLSIVHENIIGLQQINSSTFIGSGNVELLKGIVSDLEIKVVVVNSELSPVQQRNLERALKCKVIDRTGVILEIFSKRARTSEGRLQVELALLEYQKSRLVGAWTHLERQRGSKGSMTGPGELQKELDRRRIESKIITIKKELEKVSTTREVQRKSRKKKGMPIIALVGYTNAGKSTLFNYLTNENVFSEDLLFATLDPTMRKITLPSGRVVIVSDTVGFISDLPTQLINSFHATLEEVQNADIILHVRDISHSETESQKESVIIVLKELGIDYESSVHLKNSQTKILEVLNKCDLIENLEEMKEEIAQLEYKVALISATKGDGVQDLLNLIDNSLEKLCKKHLKIPQDAKDIISMCYREAIIVEREDDEDYVSLEIEATESFLKKIKPYIL